MDLRTSLALPFPSPPRDFIFPCPSFFFLSLRKKRIFSWDGCPLMLSHFQQTFVSSAFLSEFHLHFFHLCWHIPFLPQIHLQLPVLQNVPAALRLLVSVVSAPSTALPLGRGAYGLPLLILLSCVLFFFFYTFYGIIYILFCTLSFL